MNRLNLMREKYMMNIVNILRMKYIIRNDILEYKISISILGKNSFKKHFLLAW